MAKKIRIITESAGEFIVELLEKNPRTVDAVWKALPFTAKARLWGEEVYFESPIRTELEDSQVDVKVGDVAYWPPERCICLFFGRTPASKDEEPRAYSPVNVFGRLLNEPKRLGLVKRGEKLRLEKVLNKSS